MLCRPGRSDLPLRGLKWCHLCFSRIRTLLRFYQKLHVLSTSLFANGWVFIVPYLFFYLCFKYLHLNIAVLKTIFVLLHVVNALLFVDYLFGSFKKSESADFVFWIALSLLFLIPGAYLEYPSDPWEHFRRIYAWQGYAFISDNPLNYKFTYFWGWTFMSGVQPLYRRSALGVYSAFWQIVLAYQVYLLALRLGFSKLWARIQVLATICLFGTNVFSFYRYYALSSTLLAYVAYLAAMIVLMDVFAGKKKKAALLPLLVLVIYCNHFQELMLLLLSASALLLYKACERQSIRRGLLYSLPLVVLISFVLGAWVVRHPQSIPARGWDPGPPYLSWWGTVRIWDPNSPYFEAIGIHGLLSLGFAILLFRKHRRIAILTLLPVSCLVFPPFVLLFSAIVHGNNWIIYRALYAFSYSFMLVVGLKDGFELLSRRLTTRRKDELMGASVAVVVVLVSLLPSFPYRGRLWFQLYKPPAELSLQGLDATSQWLSINYTRDLACLFAGDNATATVLATQLGLAPTRRLLPYNASQLVPRGGTLKNYLEAHSICALIVSNPSKTGNYPQSRVAQLSGHWDASIVGKNLKASSDIDGALESLAVAGWTRTFVPPFYWLFEVPQRPDTPSPPSLSPGPVFEGLHDIANCDVINGWLWISAEPNLPLNVDIYDGDRLLVTQTAEQFRPELASAGKGNGYHGFHYVPPYSLRDGLTHSIQVMLAGTNTALMNTPKSLICSR